MVQTKGELRFNWSSLQLVKASPTRLSFETSSILTYFKGSNIEHGKIHVSGTRLDQVEQYQPADDAHYAAVAQFYLADIGGINIKENADSMVKCIVSINGKKINVGFGKTTKYNFIMFDQAVYSIIDGVTPSDDDSFILTADVKIILLSPSSEDEDVINKSVIARKTFEVTNHGLNMTHRDEFDGDISIEGRFILKLYQ